MDSNFLVLLELLRSDGSIVVNKKLASNIGLNEAVLYSELLSKYVYFAKKNQLTDEGYFFNTVENLQKDTTLTKRQQLTIINNLVKFGLISTKLKGIPAKRHFKIITNFENIKKYLTTQENSQMEQKGTTGEAQENSQMEQKGTTRSNISFQQEVTKGTTNNTKNNIKTNNTNSTSTTNKKNVVDVYDLKETIYKKINANISLKGIMFLLEKSNIDTINYYLDNWNKFDCINKKNISGFFINVVIENYPFPIQTENYQNKPPQATNYKQREYDEEYFNSLYDNVEFIKQI